MGVPFAPLVEAKGCIFNRIVKRFLLGEMLEQRPESGPMVLNMVSCGCLKSIHLGPGKSFCLLCLVKRTPSRLLFVEERAQFIKESDLIASMAVGVSGLRDEEVSRIHILVDAPSVQALPSRMMSLVSAVEAKHVRDQAAYPGPEQP